MPEVAGLRLPLGDGASGTTRGTLTGGGVRELTFELSYDADEGVATAPGQWR